MPQGAPIAHLHEAVVLSSIALLCWFVFFLIANLIYLLTPALLLIALATLLLRGSPLLQRGLAHLAAARRDLLSSPTARRLHLEVVTCALL